MGLDMYLDARLPLPPQREETAAMREAIGRAIGYTAPTVKPGNDATLLEVTAVTVRVGYWYGFDALHQWLVNHIQEGNDDGRPAWVDPAVLADLHSSLAKVQRDPARAELYFPPGVGQLIASEDLHYTLDILKHALRLQKAGWDIYYQSSW